MDFTKVLPEECVSLIISLTSPSDACRSAVVSSALRSVADSDAVWERFLPSDYKHILSSGSAQTTSLLSMRKKKDLYLHLSLRPILIGNGTMSFQLERETGKKCYMLGAKALAITWGDTPRYWRWRRQPESRFRLVAKLEGVWWLEVRGKIESRALSRTTKYGAYLVYKFDSYKYGFAEKSVGLSVNVGSGLGEVGQVFLDPAPREDGPQERADGWMEIEMGQFFNECGDVDGDIVECVVREVDGFYKRGIIIQGIELRPKHT